MLLRLLACLGLLAPLGALADPAPAAHFLLSGRDTFAGWSGRNAFSAGCDYRIPPHAATVALPLLAVVYDDHFEKCVTFQLEGPQVDRLAATNTTDQFVSGGIPVSLPPGFGSYLGQGKFYVAIAHDQVRLSNILTIAVQAAAPRPTGPLLQVAGLAEPGQPISALGIRFVPPNPVGNLTYSMLFNYVLTVDGIPRRNTADIASDFIEGPVRPGLTYGQLIWFDALAPPIAPLNTHVVQVTIGNISSGNVTVATDPALEKVFDQALATPKPQVFEGLVPENHSPPQ